MSHAEVEIRTSVVKKVSDSISGVLESQKNDLGESFDSLFSDRKQHTCVRTEDV